MLATSSLATIPLSLLIPLLILNIPISSAHKKTPCLIKTGCFRNNELAMTYSHMGNPTLPSAQRGFTSEFGKGSGGSLLLLSPAQLFMDTCLGLIKCLSFLPNELLTDYIWVEYCHTNGLLNQAVLMNIESIELYTTTVWVLYSQASRVISIGQLHISLCFHIQPINVVVFNGSLEDI